MGLVQRSHFYEYDFRRDGHCPEHIIRRLEREPKERGVVCVYLIRVYDYMFSLVYVMSAKTVYTRDGVIF
jgi:hypothetical protein